MLDNRMILWGMRPMANAILNCVDIPPRRLAVWNSLISTVEYMGDQYRPYTSPMWKTALPGGKSDDLDEIIHRRRFCAAAGVEHQLGRMVYNLDGVLGEKAVAARGYLLRVAPNALMVSSCNDIAERFCAISRRIGNANPARPCRMPAFARELRNRFSLLSQQDWHTALIKQNSEKKKTLAIWINPRRTSTILGLTT